MAGMIDFTLLDRDAPGKIATSVTAGYQSAEDRKNKLAQQDIQNKLSEYTLSKAKREDELNTNYLSDMRAAGTDQQKVKEAMIRAGKAKEALEMDRLMVGMDKDKALTAKTNLEYFHAAGRDLGVDPNEENVVKWARLGVDKGIFDFTQAQGQVKRLLSLSPVDRQKEMVTMGATAGDMIKRYTPVFEKFDLGNKVVRQGYDLMSGAPVGESNTYAKGMGPGEAQRIGLEQQRIDQSERHFQEKKASETNLGKPPSGYRWTADGKQEPIPGGPKDMSLKNKALSEAAKVKAEIITKNIDDALKEAGFFSTGFIGETTGIIPGTPGYSLEATLDTVKANIGFNELQAMRQASPTGGALGQVAVRELDMLQATLGSLKKGQRKDKLVQQLNSIKTHYSNWKNAVDKAAQEPTATPQTTGGVKFLGFE